jgi:class 3 adenylate cyclase/DNA-binding MarR family transcriptional regulator
MNKPARSGVQRRLAAIFCADVAGYTRLMNADERGTLRLLTSLREITDREIAEHGGRIANTAGDSILAEFPSAVDAVQCGISIQERIAAVNASVPDERRVTFRIGVHVGETLVRDGDLFGDSVNVAARLQALAQPGTVCVSSATLDYVHRVLPLFFEDLGPQWAKNLDSPVRAYLTRPTDQRPSRAVPFVHSRFEVHLIRRMNTICMAALAEVASSAEIEAIDVPALASINDEPNITSRQLAARIGIEQAAADRISARLERRGLIKRIRSANPSRSRLLSPTPEGVKVRLNLRSAVLVAQDRLMAPLSDQERETLKDLLARVLEANSRHA